MDLFRTAGDSVNDFADREAYSVSFCKFDDAVRLVTQASLGVELAKQDIKHAFRLVPARFADWHLLGYRVEKLYFLDVVLPFGSRSSHFLFCMISEALEWILKNQASTKYVLHYMDHFLLLGSVATGQCRTLLDRFLRSALNLVFLWRQTKPKGPQRA